MADMAAEPKRWVVLSLLHHAVLRTEAEIEELKGARLFVRDASGPDDSHAADVPAVTPVAAPRPPAPVPAGDKPGG